MKGEAAIHLKIRVSSCTLVSFACEQLSECVSLSGIIPSSVFGPTPPQSVKV